MVFKESSIGRESKGLLPIDVNSAENLQRYFESQEKFQENFELQGGSQKALLEELNNNDDGLLYRGVQPEDIFQLINEGEVEIKPYHYDGNDAESLSEDDLQNASYSYERAIPFGADRTERGDDEKYRYDFLSAVGFRTGGGIMVKETGRKMAVQSAGGDIDLADKEEDVSIEGTLRPQDIEKYSFRFPVKDKKTGKWRYKTLVYQRKHRDYEHH